MMTAERTMDQAASTAEYWMIRAKSSIDGIFGDGYAAKNPVLVAGFMQSAAVDELAMHTLEVSLAIQNHAAIEDK